MASVGRRWCWSRCWFRPRHCRLHRRTQIRLCRSWWQQFCAPSAAVIAMFSANSLLSISKASSLSVKTWCCMVVLMPIGLHRTGSCLPAVSNSLSVSGTSSHGQNRVFAPSPECNDQTRPSHVSRDIQSLVQSDGLGLVVTVLQTGLWCHADGPHSPAPRVLGKAKSLPKSWTTHESPTVA